MGIDGFHVSLAYIYTIWSTDMAGTTIYGDSLYENLYVIPISVATARLESRKSVKSSQNGVSRNRGYSRTPEYRRLTLMQNFEI
jgi:hypothetical protein